MYAGKSIDRNLKAGFYIIGIFPSLLRMEIQPHHRFDRQHRLNLKGNSF